MKIGTYAVEQDYSHYVKQLNKTVLAVLGTASKGELGKPTLITSTQELVNKFGLPRAEEGKVDYGLYAAMYFLSQSSKLYFVGVSDPDSEFKAASLIVKGGTDDPELAPDYTVDALKVTALTTGDHMNEYTLDVVATTVGVHSTDGEISPSIFEFILKDKEGKILEDLKGIACLPDIEVNSKYYKVDILTHPINCYTAGTYKFEGGVGTTKEVSYETAADTLLSEYIDINMIAAPGVTDYDTISYMIKTAGKRGDCLYLVDPPQGFDKDEIVTWIDEYYENVKTPSLDPELDLSYGALYYDWTSIYDSFSKKTVLVPPSVYVAATFARSDKIADVWYAPAGLTRGKVNGVIETETPISKKDAEDLYAANINPLYSDPQVGLVLWGQKTLQEETTALNRVNVRRLMNYLKKVITAACNYLTFEPNDRTTWNSFELKVKPILENVKTKRGIYEYRIIQGEAIVTDNDIDNYRMPCMVLIRPTKAAEEIPIYFTITNTGADFNDVLDANGIITETN